MTRPKKTNLEKAQTAINNSVKKLSEDETMKLWEWLKALFNHEPDRDPPIVEIKTVEVFPKEFNLEIGTSSQITVIAKDAAGKTVKVNFTFESDNPKIAEVSQTGKIVGVSKGGAILSVYAPNKVFSRTPVNVKEQPIIILPPTVRIAEDFPGASIAYKINAAFASLKGEPGTVKALNGGNLETNAIVEENCILELKGRFVSKLGDLPRTYGGQTPFWVKHNSTITAEKQGDAVIVENKNLIHVGNDSPYTLIQAFDTTYNKTPERFNYTETTRGVKIQNLDFEGIETNRHDGGGNATVFAGNAWDWLATNLRFFGTTPYAFDFGSTPDPSDERKTTFANSCTVRKCEFNNMISQTLGLINLNGCLFEDLIFNGSGRLPYKIKAVDGDKIILEREAGINNMHGCYIEGANEDSNLNSTDNRWILERIDNLTYKLLYKINGSGVEIAGSKPSIKNYNGKAILFGTTQIQVGSDVEPNGAKGEKASNNIFRNFIYNLRDAYVGNNAFVFQPNDVGQERTGNRIENMKIFGSLRGFTYNGVQMSNLTEDFTIDGLYADYCGCALIASGKNNSFKNIVIDDSGTGGNTAILLTGLTDSRFEDVSMNSKNRGVAEMSEGAGNSGNKFNNIYSNGVKIK